MRRRPDSIPSLKRELQVIQQMLGKGRGNLSRLAKACGVSRQQASLWFSTCRRVPSADAMLVAMRWAEEESSRSTMRFFPSWKELSTLAQVMFRVKGMALAFACFAEMDRRRVSDYFGKRRGGNLMPDGLVALQLLSWLDEQRRENDVNLNFPLANDPAYWRALMAICSGLEMMRGAREGITGCPHHF